jgi:predicted nuclease of restriction endonuclease-like (RecB) superfamily
MIEGQLHAREGKSLTNFSQTLPPENSEMAVQVLRDPYNFDFLTLAHPLEERKLERGLLAHMRDLLLELGRGFAFVGSQVPLTVGEETFYLDLLFYHVRLHCYFVIELKTGKFKPEYAGKLNFYLSAVDGIFRTQRDDPTIGLLLCESHEGAVVEYSFQDIQKPIGVSSYRVTRELRLHCRKTCPLSKICKEWSRSCGASSMPSAAPRRTKPREKTCEYDGARLGSPGNCAARAGRSPADPAQADGPRRGHLSEFKAQLCEGPGRPVRLRGWSPSH